MRPTDVPGRIDHRGNHQPEDKPDTHMRHLAVREGIDHDRPTSRKNECECADAFGDTRRHKGNIPCEAHSGYAPGGRPAAVIVVVLCVLTRILQVSPAIGSSHRHSMRTIPRLRG